MTKFRRPLLFRFSAILLLLNGKVVGTVQLRSETSEDKEVAEWAGFLCELIGELTSFIQTMIITID